jgi:hypothetical protein
VQLADKSTIKIRINVCARSLPERSPHHSPYVYCSGRAILPPNSKSN